MVRRGGGGGDRRPGREFQAVGSRQKKRVLKQLFKKQEEADRRGFRSNQVWRARRQVNTIVCRYVRSLASHVGPGRYPMLAAYRPHCEATGGVGVWSRRAGRVGLKWNMPYADDVYVKGLTANLTGALLEHAAPRRWRVRVHSCLRCCRISTNGIAPSILGIFSPAWSIGTEG